MAACGNGQPGDCEDCVRVVRSVKTVQVPCTVNKYQKYTVKVPRQVTQQVPRTVRYTDFETRSKQVPYTDWRSERRTRMETQKYQVPVTTTHTKMVNVTKKVPRTVYVNITTQVPKSYQRTSIQTRERQVPVPYFVNVPETKYRTVTEQVPVQKSRVQMDTVTKIVYDTKVRTRCVPETKIVTKQIPVYNLVPRPAPPCPPSADCGISGDLTAGINLTDDEGDGMLNNNEGAFEAADAVDQYAGAHASGDLGNAAVNGYAVSGGFGQADGGFGQVTTGMEHSSGYGQALRHG